MDQLKKISSLLVGVCLLAGFMPGLVRAQVAAGSEIEIIGPAGLVSPDQTFTVELQLQSHGQEINAAEIHLRYDRAVVSFVSAGRAQSIFTLWPEEPQVDEDTGDVVFVGGRPSGIISVGGIIATVTFAARISGPAIFSVDQVRSAAYLNDGQGTKQAVVSTSITVPVIDDLGQGIHLTSTTHPTAESWSRGRSIAVHWDKRSGSAYSYSLSPDRQMVPDEVGEAVTGDVTYDNLDDGVYYFTLKERAANATWSAVYQRPFQLDATPPEPFDLSQIPGPLVGGKKLLSWVALDATSGIAAYRLSVGVRNSGLVTSPIIFSHNWRGQTIVITAEDAAGNTRDSRFIVDQGPPLLAVWLILGVVVLLGGGLLVRRWRK